MAVSYSQNFASNKIRIFIRVLFHLQFKHLCIGTHTVHLQLSQTSAIITVFFCFFLLSFHHVKVSHKLRKIFNVMRLKLSLKMNIIFSVV